MSKLARSVAWGPGFRREHTHPGDPDQRPRVRPGAVHRAGDWRTGLAPHTLGHSKPQRGAGAGQPVHRDQPCPPAGKDSRVGKM